MNLDLDNLRKANRQDGVWETYTYPLVLYVSLHLKALSTGDIASYFCQSCASLGPVLQSWASLWIRI